MKVYRKLGSPEELILVNVKNYSGYCDYKMRILLFCSTREGQRQLLHCTGDFKGVPLRQQDAEKLTTFCSVNSSVFLSLKVTDEWLKEKFYSRCFCNPVGFIMSKKL